MDGHGAMNTKSCNKRATCERAVSHPPTHAYRNFCQSYLHVRVQSVGHEVKLAIRGNERYGSIVFEPSQADTLHHRGACK